MLEQEQAQMPAHFDSLEVQTLTPLPIPRDKRGRIRWSVIVRQPDMGKGFMEEEGRQIMAALEVSVLPPVSVLREMGRGDFYHGVRRFYPGGTTELGKILGQQTLRKPSNYWNTDTVLEEAKGFSQQFGRLSQPVLHREKRSDLAAAAKQYYPGGLRQLQIDLGLNPTQKPKGFYTEERMRQEALEYYQQAGKISDRTLRKARKFALSIAISKRYLGGMAQLRADLDLEAVRKPKGYWTPETIEKEAREFYEREGNLSEKLLTTRGRNDLRGAISNRYPGRMIGLKERLGIGKKQNVSPTEANEQLKKLLEEQV